MEESKKEYGLCTAIAMIVGVVIGSGIFFKSDDILRATNGSIALGVLVFILAAISIIFGSLSIAELASRSSKAGGVITYAEASSPVVACGFGWFQCFLYFPTLIAVVAWVAGIYTCILFGIEATLLTEILIGLGYIIVLFGTNILSAKLSGFFQTASTIIKLIPLLVIAFAGLMVGDPSYIRTTDVTQMQSLGWLSAIAPIAFSFDGWIAATSIGHQIKDSTKNLPLALIISPIFILIIYILYFVGISTLVGPEQVMANGDAHVDMAAHVIFGELGAKLILIFVVISVVGTVNGLIMAASRLPYALALRGMFPKSETFSRINEKGLPLPSIICSFGLIMFWLFVHFNTMAIGIDISEISVGLSYLGYIYLYFQVIKLRQQGEITSNIKGYVIPIIATLGSLIILSGSIGNDLFLLYFGICAAVVFSAMAFYKKKISNPN
ncbi:MAG: amino acid permease [Epulopiscium sp. Nele67-Bin005]|nr:MAG: amino acid permease [Epulopiscium sp. Nele67-Bin005]